MKNIKIIPKNLKGFVDVPPSKSMSHRALICGGLSKEKSHISNLIMSKDIEATIGAMTAYSSSFTNAEENNGRYSLNALLDGDITKINGDIYCKESGSTIRFMIPFAGLVDEEMTYYGEGRLVERPLGTYYDIFDEQRIEYKTDNGKLPLTIKGRLKSGSFKVPGNISSQFVSGLMFVLPLLDGDSTIDIQGNLESKGYVDLTMNCLKSFGIEIENDEYKTFKIRGNQSYQGRDYRVEGDFSQAAFWLVAGTIGGKLILNDIDIDSLQGDRVIVDIINKMGGCIDHGDNSLIALPRQTKGISIDASECPDLVPILAVLASVSEGTTKIYNAERVRIKESDRLKAMATELKKLGADINETEDGLIINGVESLSGGVVDSWNDHRIAMAMAVASIRADEPVIIQGSESVSKSYPHFWDDYKMLGGNIDEWILGE